jgi:hypothetical protein
VLRHLPAAREPGHRRQIAAEPTGGRVLPRGRPVHPAIDRSGVSPPPLPLSLVCGPRGDSVIPTRPRRLPPWAATGPAPSRPHARCAWLGQNPPSRPTSAEIPFFSFSFSAFSLLINTSQYFMHQKLSKIILKSHVTIMLESDTLQLVNHC